MNQAYLRYPAPPTTSEPARERKRGPAGADAGQREERDLLRTLRATRRSPASPLNVVSIAVMCSSALFISLAFLVMTSRAMAGLVGDIGPWLFVPVTLLAVIPLIIGPPSFYALMRHRGQQEAVFGERRPRLFSAVSLGDQHLIGKNFRWIPLVVPAAMLQSLAFHTVLLGAGLTVLLEGRIGSVEPSSAIPVTLWVCVQVTLIMAVHSGFLMSVRLAMLVVSTGIFVLLVPDLDFATRIAELARPMLLIVLVYSAQRFVLEVGYVAGSLRIDRQRRFDESNKLQAAVTEAGRIEDLIHDNILSCLLLTSRGGARDDWAAGQIKHHAATALETLDEIANPSDTPELVPVGTDTFIAQLSEQVRLLDAQVDVSVQGRRRSAVPAEVSHALTTASLEAVRNSLRHADGALRRGGSVRRRVKIGLSDTHITIEVEDNGVGFEPDLVPPRAIGLRGSILRRVQQLPGGHAGVAAAPMRGTVVHMSWTDVRKAASHDARSPAHPRGQQRGQPAHQRRGAGLSSHQRPERTQPELALEDYVDFKLRSPQLTAMVSLVLVFTFVHMVASLPSFDPWWPSVSAFLVLVLLVYIVSRNWSTPTGAPPPWLSPSLGLVAPIMLALTLPAFTAELERQTDIWTLVIVPVVLCSLALSRYDAAAIIGTVTSTALIITWAVMTEQSQGWQAGGWPSLVISVIFCSVMGRWATSRMSSAAQLQSDREHSIAQDVERTEVLRQRRNRSAELDLVVRPLITRLASNEPVTAQMELEAGLLESRLRDDMRARCFHGTDVARAAWEARARGVFVELMDDGGLAVSSSALKGAVVTVVSGRIDQAIDGQITVRVLPADREVVASVLYRPTSGANVRTEIFEDGRARTEST